MPSITGQRHERRPARVAMTALALIAAAALVSVAAAAPGDGIVLTLDDAVSLAQQNDQILQQAAEAVRGAEAGVTGANSGRLPQLSLSGRYTSNLKKGVMFLPPDMAAGFGGRTSIEMGRDYTFQGAATLTLNLWTAGRLSAATGAAREALAASHYDQALVADAVRYQATAAYMAVLLAEQNVAIAEKALEETGEARRVAQAGYDQGTTSRFDLLRAEVEVW